MDSLECLVNVVNFSTSIVDVSVSSTNILNSARDVRAAAGTMANAVEELSNSITEIESSAKRSLHVVDQSSQLTSEGMKELTGLRSQIGDTGRLFDAVAGKTKDLQEVVSNLGKVVDLISKIAGQTNLLALNATIESARAGEHGRGFAVVASEVKSLSRQTAEATETIRGQIKNLNDSFANVLETVSCSRATMDSVVSTAEKVGHDFESISGHSASITHQVGELADIISQQKSAVELLAKNMSVVASREQENLVSVEKLVDETDQTVALVENMRAKLAMEDIANKVIYLAKADHVLWKKKLLDMASGRAKTKSSELANHTLCRLGKWYYAQSDESMRHLSSFRAIEEPHRQVHFHGIEAAKCFESGKTDEGMEHYRKLEGFSRLVLKCLDSLLIEVTELGKA